MKLLIGLIGLTGFSLNLFICFWFLCSFYYRTYKSDSRSKNHIDIPRTLSAKCLYFVAIVSLFFFALVQLLNAFVAFDFDFIHDAQLSFDLIITNASMIAFISTMIFYVWRIYFSFKNSSFAITKKQITCYIILIIFCLITYMMDEIAQFIVNHTSINEKKSAQTCENWQMVGDITIILFCLLSCLFVFIISYTFGKGLFELILIEKSNIIYNKNYNSKMDSRSGINSINTKINTNINTNNNTNINVKHKMVASASKDDINTRINSGINYNNNNTGGIKNSNYSIKNDNNNNNNNNNKDVKKLGTKNF